jgi:acetyltransferase-like isoleucine patch superfamily enzyme
MTILFRAIQYFKQNTFRNVLRKCMYFLIDRLRALCNLFRKIRFFFFTDCWVKRIRGRVYIYGLGNHVTIGKDAILYGENILEINEKATLFIGNHFTLSYGSLIACHYNISIGDHVMIGEYSSIRDTTHVYNESAIPYCLQPDKSDKISIGNNVWIGRGCIILPGTIIEDGVIIAANSVVKGFLNKDCIYGGTPVKLLKKLKE